MESEGELVVRSKAMFSGYLNNEEATRAKLKDGWLYTGDIVSVDAGRPVPHRGPQRGLHQGERLQGVRHRGGESNHRPRLGQGVRRARRQGRVRIGANRRAHRSYRLCQLSRGMEAVLIKELRTVLSEYKLPKRCVVWPALPKSPMGKI